MHTPTPPSAHACTQLAGSFIEQLFQDLNHHFARQTAEMAQLLHQQLALQGLDAQGLTLRGTPATRRIYHSGSSFYLRDAAGNEDAYYQRHTRPEGWADAGVLWHPAHWRRSRERYDQHGVLWRSSIDGIFVQDDYGNLVEVAQ